MATAGASRGLVGLIKRGWNEIPEVMASSVLALIGISLGLYGVCKHYIDKNEMRTYKFHYTVYRPDDPKVEELRKYKIIE